ncbi:uncharacterized protein LOC129198416 [Grus americana]|uniref:uncharacterized protein LOC129198416 n=1 Tax=Grus americana TaxID=9117 RepID=UPI0024081422|nr:uncharacterized protein LOC129198416 [Grus americana]XP_054663682.1 uncharacterized protein LOC129198416 [Grus americana]
MSPPRTLGTLGDMDPGVPMSRLCPPGTLGTLGDMDPGVPMTLLCPHDPLVSPCPPPPRTLGILGDMDPGVPMSLRDTGTPWGHNTGMSLRLLDTGSPWGHGSRVTHVLLVSPCPLWDTGSPWGHESEVSPCPSGTLRNPLGTWILVCPHVPPVCPKHIGDPWGHGSRCHHVHLVSPCHLRDTGDMTLGYPHVLWTLRNLWGHGFGDVPMSLVCPHVPQGHWEPLGTWTRGVSMSLLCPHVPPKDTGDPWGHGPRYPHVPSVSPCPTQGHWEPLGTWTQVSPCPCVSLSPPGDTSPRCPHVPAVS